MSNTDQEQLPLNTDLETLTLPSKLRPTEGRHDEVKQRTKALKGFAISHRLDIPENFSADEHYWFTVMNLFHNSNTKLEEFIADRKLRHLASLNIALSHATPILEAEQARSIDGLTGAWSRGALDNYLTNILKISGERKTKVGVLMIDVDHFKKYNDTQGHQAGDKILIDMVNLLQESVRGHDMVARYGGEEFMVILPTLSDVNLASERAEEMRQQIAEKLGITVSIGTTSVTNEDIDISTIYNRADQNLYRAKDSGRNSVFNDNGKVKLTPLELQIEDATPFPNPHKQE